MVPDAPHAAVVGYHTAPVAVNKPTNERRPLVCQELILPRREADFAVVFAAGANLREQAWPVVRVRHNDVASTVRLSSDRHTVCRTHGLNGLATRLHDERIRGIQKNAKAIRSRMTGDMSVTEIKAKEVRIWRRRKGPYGWVADRALLGPSASSPTRNEPATPVTDRRARDLRSPGNFHIGQTESRQGERSFHFLTRMHTNICSRTGRTIGRRLTLARAWRNWLTREL